MNDPRDAIFQDVSRISYNGGLLHRNSKELLETEISFGFLCPSLVEGDKYSPRIVVVSLRPLHVVRLRSPRAFRR